MSYVKTAWKDLPDRTTPVTAARLNNAETQYDQALLDAPAVFPVASETVQGKVELATSAEVTAGVDASRAVTAAGLKVALDGLTSSGRGLILGATGKNYREVACTIRNTGTGFALLSDASHGPVGVSAVSQDATGVTITYDFTAAKVVSFVATVDETLAKLGYTVGASVGMSSAVLQFGMPAGAVDYVSWNGTAWTSFTGFVTSTTMNGTTGLIAMNHAAMEPTVGGSIQLRTNGDNRISQDGMGATTSTCTVFPYNSNVSLKTATTDMRFWLFRAGARTVPPTELVQAGSNIWIRGLFEIA